MAADWLQANCRYMCRHITCRGTHRTVYGLCVAYVRICAVSTLLPMYIHMYMGPYTCTYTCIWGHMPQTLRATGHYHLYGPYYGPCAHRSVSHCLLAYGPGPLTICPWPRVLGPSPLDPGPLSLAHLTILCPWPTVIGPTAIDLVHLPLAHAHWP